MVHGTIFLIPIHLVVSWLYIHALLRTILWLQVVAHGAGIPQALLPVGHRVQQKIPPSLVTMVHGQELLITPVLWMLVSRVLHQVVVV
jgi:hypothetical protein